MNIATGELSANREVSAPLELLTGLRSFQPQPQEPVRIGVGQSQIFLGNTSSFEANLFKATAEVKIWASQVAMRLEPSTRARIFRQIDMLHNPDDWMPGDKPVQLSSFKSFVRAMLIKAVKGVPSLALTPDGLVTALWQLESSQLNVQFLADDKVKFLLTRHIGSETDRVAGTTVIQRLAGILNPLVNAS
jgi:hypothetical protein